MDVDPDAWRPLTENEVALLEILTSLDYLGAAQLRDQVPHAEARRGCKCGCGTIDLRVRTDSALPAQVSRSRPVPGEAEIIATSPPGGLILFVADGYLGSLEVYGFGDSPLPLPTPDEIRPYVRDE